MGNGKNDVIAHTWLRWLSFAGMVLQPVAIVTFLVALVWMKLTDAALLGVAVGLVGFVLIIVTAKLSNALRGWLYVLGFAMMFSSVTCGLLLIWSTGAWWVGLADCIVQIFIGLTALWLLDQSRQND